jgi:hypothetical protein
MRRAVVLMLTLLVGVLAPAAAARAATLAPIKPCYVSAGQADDAREQISVMAQGFTPNQTATVAIDGATMMDNAQVDPLGTISGSIAAPFQARDERPFTLSIVENGNAANTVSAQSLVTALDVTVKPANARPSSRVRFRGRGFTGGPAVYGHYLRNGRLRKTVLLASTSGPCGTFDVRRRQLAVKHPHRGRWTLQIDQAATWRAEPQSVRVLLVIDVTRGPAGNA